MLSPHGTDAIIYLDGLLVLLELEVSVGEEDLLAPGGPADIKAGQPVLGGHSAAQLQPRPPVGRLQTHGLAQGGNGELREEAFWLA